MTVLLNSSLRALPYHPYFDGAAGLLTLVPVMLLVISTDQWFLQINRWWQEGRQATPRNITTFAPITVREFLQENRHAWRSLPKSMAMLALTLLLFLIGSQAAVAWHVRQHEMGFQFDPRQLSADALPLKLADWQRQSFAGGQHAGLLGRDWPLQRWEYRNGERVLSVSVAGPTAWPCWTDLTRDGWEQTSATWIHTQSGDVAAIEYRGRLKAWDRSTVLLRGFCNSHGNLLAWNEEAQAAAAGPEASPAFALGTVACLEVQITSSQTIDDETLRTARGLLNQAAQAVAEQVASQEESP
jgi:hypothetical protein